MYKYLFVLCISAILTAISQSLLKISSGKKYNSFLSQYINPYVISGYAIFFIVLGINIYVLKYLNMIVANAFNESVPYIFTLILSVVIFKEKFTINKLIGAIFILAGILVIII